MDSTQYLERLTAALKALAGVHGVGEEYVRLVSDNPPYGGLDYFGQLVSRTMYSSLWSYLQEHSPRKIISESAWQEMYVSQNGNVPYYSTGDDVSTFRLPCIRGYFKSAGAVTEIGTYQEEGIPNITGHITSLWYPPGTSGVFYNEYILENGASPSAGNNSFKDGGATFDASRCSPVYGKSAHVTPETMTLVMGVYAFGVNAPIGEVTETGLIAEVNNLDSIVASHSAEVLRLEREKSDCNLSNLTVAGRDLGAKLSLPGGRGIDLTLGAAQSRYYPPAAGYITINAHATTAGAWIYVANETRNIRHQQSAYGFDYQIGATIPVMPGDSVYIDYWGVDYTHTFRFIYAEGAN